MNTLFIILILFAVLVCGLFFLPAFKHRKHAEAAGLRLPCFLSALLLIASFSLYAFRGSPLLIPELDAYETFLAEKRIEIETLSRDSRLAPKDAQIKASLANAYASIRDFARAKELYREAIVLSNGSPQYILRFGKMQMMEADGTVTQEAKKAFEMVLMQEKENPMALYYLAIEAKQQNRNAEAKERFRHVLKLLPEGIPLRSTIEKQMKEIE